MEPQPKLLPCPFCGEAPRMKHQESYEGGFGNMLWPLPEKTEADWYEVHCVDCGFYLGQFGKAEAANRWNTRTPAKEAGK